MSKFDWAMLYVCSVAVLLDLAGTITEDTPSWLVLVPTAVAVWIIVKPKNKGKVRNEK